MCDNILALQFKWIETKSWIKLAGNDSDTFNLMFNEMQHNQLSS